MKKLRYQCLILDHDDTTVDSTAHIHYPSFLRSMAELRPEVSMTLEEYFQMNCDPGIGAYYRDVVKLTPEEAEIEHRQWSAYTLSRVPKPFPGIKELMESHRSQGGYLCVVSHNRREHILRDYAENDLPQPDLIFGCDYPREQQKPYPWPVRQILKQLDLKPEHVIMIDDLIPGYEMARKAGIDFAAACWAHQTEMVTAFMHRHGVPCFYHPGELREYLEIPIGKA